MSNQFDRARELSKQGFWLFPVVSSSSALPDSTDERRDTVFKKDTNEASSRDYMQLKRWFNDDDNNNIGIDTGAFSDEAALIVVDVDNEKGAESVLALELDGRELPVTLEMESPFGGRYLIYRARAAVESGEALLGEGLSVHSRGSFILADTMKGKSVAAAPAWLVRCLADESAEDDSQDEGSPDVMPASVSDLNKRFAFVMGGSIVLEETTDEDGNPILKRHTLKGFNSWFENKRITLKVNNKLVEKSKAQWWLRDENRREYEAVVFAPGRELGPRFYNLWRGFTVTPIAEGETPNHPALDMFLEHALENVCNNDVSLFSWLMGFFAQLIQNPGKKPAVAPVFKGLKGTGKNVLVERVGALLGTHFMVADDDRYLLGNFNAHLENCLFMVLDEANWAGDKKAEGRLKGIISGTKHNIEYKGHEAYQAKNLTRIAIIGNENWLVPATEDERRYAVFTMGTKRRLDRKFFGAMEKGLKEGGYAHLLRYLLDFDLSTVDVDVAPQTDGLVEQKIESLDVVAQWWYACLQEGQLLGGDRGEDSIAIPERIATTRLRAAFEVFALKSMNLKGRLPTPTSFGRSLSNIAKSLDKHKVNKPSIGESTWVYVSPGLDKLRVDFEMFLGGSIKNMW